MRIAIVSDIHGNRTAFEAVLADLQQTDQRDDELASTYAPLRQPVAVHGHIHRPYIRLVSGTIAPTQEALVFHTTATAAPHTSWLTTPSQRSGVWSTMSTLKCKRCRALAFRIPIGLPGCWRQPPSRCPDQSDEYTGSGILSHFENAFRSLATMKTLIAIFILHGLFSVSAHAKTEFGKIQGAEYRIDVPDTWNHGLVVYCHGYDPHPGGVHYDPAQALEQDLAVFVKAGYAVIQSGYSRGGWALEQAIPEIEAVRKLFVEKYGPPKETYITGHSLGGLLTVAILERLPRVYDAGLDLCGVVGDATEVLSRAFDHRVIFDYFFPGALPSPAEIPQDFQLSAESTNRLYDQLQANPRAAATVRKVTRIHSDKDLANITLFGTYVLKDIEHRAGGNPFDNRNTIYLGTDDDNALNDGVKRYAADTGALAYLKRHQTLTGHLTRPVLAVHTTYDPLVSPEIPNAYSLRAREAGSGNLFVQQYVKHDGHCAITPEEIDHGFKELRRWKETGQRPNAGWLH